MAKTQEKVYIIAGSEFGPLEGHTLVIEKVLYRLRSSGLQWHEKLADSLQDMNFSPTQAEDGSWMQKNGELYKYVTSYVYDLCIVAKDLTKIIQLLESQHHYRLKERVPSLII